MQYEDCKVEKSRKMQFQLFSSHDKRGIHKLPINQTYRSITNTNKKRNETNIEWLETKLQNLWTIIDFMLYVVSYVISARELR